MQCSIINGYDTNNNYLYIQMGPKFGAFLANVRWHSPVELHLRKGTKTIALTVIELTIRLVYVICCCCYEE